MKIKFCGAATGVTGSCHMISSGDQKILLDCGQFQGGKAQDALNAEPFPFDPAEIQCVVLSHAHIDHCGRLPLLVKRGFRGDIYCTDATADLLEIMLKDSGYIHEKEAQWQNRKNERAGKPPVDPLYTFNDAADTLKYIHPVMYDELVEINSAMRIVFNDAGHILGSAITELWVEEDEKVSKIVFSGDLGVMDRPILRNPTIIKKADYLIMETTYGNRVHPPNITDVHKLIDIVLKTTRRGGTVVIPSFAVGRTQELIYEFNKYVEEGGEYSKELGAVKVYVDSPMATSATEAFRKNAQVFDEETREYIMKGDDPLAFPSLEFTKSTDDSRRLNMDRSPKVIISASGMCEAGRIRHHLKHNLWDPRSTVVFVGYQAEGTLGRNLIEGLKDVTLFGERIHVNAEICDLEGFSGHADKEGLLHWLEGFQQRPRQIFLVHGESQSKADFAEEIKEKLGYDATVVSDVSEFQLESATLLSREQVLRDAMDDETFDSIKSRISEIHDDLETILYNTSLRIGDNKIDPEKLAAINNAVIELEKSTVRLGASVAEPVDADDA